MYLKKIRVFNFRNFVEQEVEFGPGMNFIIGENGHGKTNLIEGINLLSTTKSFRSSKVSELLRWENSEGSIFGTLAGSSSDYEIGMVLCSRNREAYVNGEKLSSLAEFVGRFSCVSFSPTDLKLVQGGPGERRRFLDKHLVDFEPGMMRVMMNYQRALKNKNKLLKGDRVDSDQIAPWNEIMIEAGSELIEGRKRLLDKIEGVANELYLIFSDAHDGDLRLGITGNVTPSGEEDLKDRFRKELDIHSERERARGSSTVGPHRDDLEIELGGQNARSFASQGQAKSIVISLKLAVFSLLIKETGEVPVVLLDDVESELDQGRVRRLFETIADKAGQVFITGTNREVLEQFRGEDSRVFEVVDGVVSGVDLGAGDNFQIGVVNS